MSADLIVRHGTLHTMAGPPRPRAGGEAEEMAVVPDGAVVLGQGRILWVGRDAELPSSYQGPELDASHRVVTPGLVDCHTHALFAGSRAEEFALRVAGATYEELMARGGGIAASARMFREASDDQILQETATRLRRMLLMGTTTCEVKSGYGLVPDQEVRALRLIKRLAEVVPQRVVPTFLGAHALPPEWRDRRNEFVDLLIHEAIPTVAREGLATFCDVFCDVGAFTVEESRRILLAAKAAGLGLKIHADELAASGGTRLAAELGVASAEHLLWASEDDLRALRDAGSVAVVLPGTCLGLGKTRFAPAGAMMAMGLPVAVATDLNPGNCYCENLPLMMTLACLYGRMSIPQALTAVTVNGAYAVGLGHEVGTLEVGKRADLVVWDTRDYRDLVYHFGDRLTWCVVAGGRACMG